MMVILNPFRNIRVWNPQIDNDEESVADAAQKICELKLDPSDDDFKDQENFKQIRGQCWHVVFAPDESYFAWISSPRKLVVVPWDRQRNSVESQQVAEGSNKKPRSPITLHCPHPFLSVAFGIRSPDPATRKWLQAKRTSWTRFNYYDENLVVTGHTHGKVRVWKLETGALMTELIDHNGPVRDLALAPDNSLRLITASYDKTLKAWDLNEGGNLFQTFIAHKEAALWVCWSPNSKIVASAGNEKTVFIWDMKSYKLVRVLDKHFHNVVSCSFSPDGAVLATASWDTQVILWDPYAGTVLYTLHHIYPLPQMIYAGGANGAWVRGVSYAPNGMHVATVSDDHLIRMWNLMGSVDPEGIAVEDDDPLSCTYSPTGRCVAVGTDKFKVTFYRTIPEVPRLTHLARMAVRRHVLTQDVDTLEIPNPLKSFLKYQDFLRRMAQF